MSCWREVRVQVQQRVDWQVDKRGVKNGVVAGEDVLKECGSVDD